MSDTARFPVTVDVLVFAPSENGPALLCVQRAYAPFQGCWALPGGFVDMGEDLPQAAVRELMEETGVGVDSTELIQLGAFGAPGRDPRGQTITVAYIALLSDEPEVRAGDDAARACFWPVEGLLTGHGPITMAFDHDDILAAAIERLNSLELEDVEDEEPDEDGGKA